MTWTEIIKYVREAEQCGEREARRQIGNAIADRQLRVWWEDQREIPFGSTPLQVQATVPPPDAAYWLKCEIDPIDTDLVDKRTAKRLDKQRRFRKPIFLRAEVIRLWRQRPGSAKASDETQAIAFVGDILKKNNDLRRGDAFNMCRERYRKLSGRGFLTRVWPRAREAAGLSPTAPPGPKPKQKPSKTQRP